MYNAHTQNLRKEFQEFQKECKVIFACNTSEQDRLQTHIMQKRIDRASKMLQPFVLRRKKHDVLQEMPMKHVHIVSCQCTPNQMNLYQVFVD